jgi:hypothetical protein
VLRFKVNSGQDYLDQLKSMKAEIVIQVGESDKLLLIEDLGMPKKQKTSTEADFKRLAKKIHFNDSRPEAVKGILDVLGLEKDIANKFWAFFPSEVENEFAKKELSYQNHRFEDIKETIFRINVKDGKYEIEVVEQKLKR